MGKLLIFTVLIAISAFEFAQCLPKVCPYHYPGNSQALASVAEITAKCSGNENCFKAQVSRLSSLLDDTILRLIFANIRSGHIAEAREDFARLNNDSLIESIVSNVYEPTSFENLIKFIQGTACPLQISFYTALYDIMDERSDLLTFNMVIIRDRVQLLLSENGLCSVTPGDLTSILRRANSLTDEIKNTWASNIRNNHFETILEICNQKEANSAGNAVTAILPDVIISAWDSNPGNFPNLLKFISQFNWNNHKLTGFSKLWPLLSQRNDKLKFALKLKAAMDNLSGPDGNEESVRNQLLGIKSQMTPNVRGIVWHDNCYLRNEHHGNEYLYAADKNFNFNGLNGRVFTWTPGTVVSQSPWKFEAIEKPSGDIEFRVISNYWTDCKMHLGAHRPDDNFDGDRGYVSASCDETDKSFNWKIEYSESNETIKMFHLGREAYFYASQFTYQNNDRRWPFLWLPGGDVQESDWTVECTE